MPAAALSQCGLAKRNIGDIGLRFLVGPQDNQRRLWITSKDPGSWFRSCITDGHIAVRHIPGAKHTNQVSAGSSGADGSDAFAGNNQPVIALDSGRDAGKTHAQYNQAGKRRPHSADEAFHPPQPILNGEDGSTASPPETVFAAQSLSTSGPRRGRAPETAR